MFERQINQSVNLLHDILGNDILGVYLYGSAVVGGLQKYSDLDLFVVSARATTQKEKAELVAHLLKISGIYMKSQELPIEMTIVEKSEINPWRYPPKFDFQYGEWLRQEFESGNIEPWSTKLMPDLAILMTQVLLASKTLMGSPPDQLLCKVPYQDFLQATEEGIPALLSELATDTRNVLLTLARIWCTVSTDTIRSKPAAADWAIPQLPELYRPILKRAQAIGKGEEREYWADLQNHLKPCADFIISQITHQISESADKSGPIKVSGQ